MRIGTGKKQVTRTVRHIPKSLEKFKYQIKINSLIKMNTEMNNPCTYIYNQ